MCRARCPDRCGHGSAQGVCHLHRQAVKAGGAFTAVHTLIRTSCTMHSHIKCDDGRQCGRPKAGGFAPADFQSTYAPFCVMDPLHGASHTVSPVIINSATSRVGCGKCSAELTKREHFVRLPSTHCCGFPSPLEAACKLLCQVYSFRVYALV